MKKLLIMLAAICVCSGYAQTKTKTTMKLNAGIVTEKLAESKKFYTETLGFGVTFENEFYLLLHTPGHTPGSQCFLVDGRLISGDTLFIGDVARGDRDREGFQEVDFGLMFAPLAKWVARIEDAAAAAASRTAMVRRRTIMGPPAVDIVVSTVDIAPRRCVNRARSLRRRSGLQRRPGVLGRRAVEEHQDPAVARVVDVEDHEVSVGIHSR